MSSLIFAIICLYFNFIAYKEFKQVAYEIHQEENMSFGGDRGKGQHSDRSRDPEAD